MGWIFGAAGANISPENEAEFRALHGPAITRLSSGSFYIALGGIDETCLFGTDEGESGAEGFAVSGYGICGGDAGSFKRMGVPEWKNVFRAPDLRNCLRGLNGHFAGAFYHGDVIELFTDSLGTREFYVARFDGRVVFTTRLDWAAAFLEEKSFNLSALSTRWLMQNQLDCSTIVNGIERLSAGGYCRISPGGIDCSSTLYSPEPPRAGETLEGLLHGFMHVAEHEGYKLSLALSGGFDSRAILALLIAGDYRFRDTFSLGQPSHPDSIVAGMMARYYSLDRQCLVPNYSSEALSYEKLLEFSAFIQLSAPISEMPVKDHYAKLHDGRKFVIDGCWGEIARRSFGAKILITGARAIKNRDAAGILKMFSLPRAEIFAPDVHEEMKRLALQSSAKLADGMPRAGELHPADWIDLYCARFRLPNTAGFEQSRIDTQALSMSPFSQPAIHDYVFSLPLKSRKNAALFKDMIRRHAPQLEQYPLVKGNIEVPYFLHPMAGKIVGKAKKIAGRYYRDDGNRRMLDACKPLINDIIISKSFMEYSLYDTKKIIKAVEDYYKGNSDEEWFLVWFLTFELFRRVLEIK